MSNHDSFALLTEIRRLRAIEAASESAISDNLALHAMKSAALDVEIARDLLRKFMSRYPRSTAPDELLRIAIALDRAAEELTVTAVLPAPVEWTTQEIIDREA